MAIKQIGLIIAGIVISVALVAGWIPSVASAAGDTEDLCEKRGGSWVDGSLCTVPPASSGQTEAEGSDETIEYSSDKDCNGVGTSVLGKDNVCDTAGKNGVIMSILLWVIRILSIGVGIVAVGGVIFASILYTTAGSSPEQVKKATHMFVNIAIGVIMWGLMVGILNFIIPGGVFS